MKGVARLEDNAPITLDMESTRRVVLRRKVMSNDEQSYAEQALDWYNHEAKELAKQLGQEWASKYKPGKKDIPAYTTQQIEDHVNAYKKKKEGQTESLPSAFETPNNKRQSFKGSPLRRGKSTRSFSSPPSQREPRREPSLLAVMDLAGTPNQEPSRCSQSGQLMLENGEVGNDVAYGDEDDAASCVSDKPEQLDQIFAEDEKQWRLKAPSHWVKKFSQCDLVFKGAPYLRLVPFAEKCVERLYKDDEHVVAGHVQQGIERVGAAMNLHTYLKSKDPTLSGAKPLVEDAIRKGVLIPESIKFKYTTLRLVDDVRKLKLKSGQAHIDEKEIVQSLQPFGADLIADGKQTDPADSSQDFQKDRFDWDSPQMSQLKVSLEQKLNFCLKVLVNDIFKTLTAQGSEAKPMLIRFCVSMLALFRTASRHFETPPGAVLSTMKVVTAMLTVVCPCHKDANFKLLLQVQADFEHARISPLSSLRIIFYTAPDPWLKDIYEDILKHAVTYTESYAELVEANEDMNGLDSDDEDDFVSTCLELLLTAKKLRMNLRSGDSLKFERDLAAKVVLFVAKKQGLATEPGNQEKYAEIKSLTDKSVVLWPKNESLQEVQKVFQKVEDENKNKGELVTMTEAAQSVRDEICAERLPSQEQMAHNMLIG